MSADVINANIEPPVWTVHGVNWTVEIPLDKYNAQFTPELQAYEAATKALMVFKGKSSEFFMVMDDGEEVPYLGETMVVHIKGTNPTQGVICYTHTVLANEGLYAESIKMAREFIRKVEALEKEAAANPEIAKALRAAIQELSPPEPKKKKVKKAEKTKNVKVTPTSLDSPEMPPVEKPAE